MTTIVDILSDNGIRLKRYAANSEERIVCPKCNDREKSLSVRIDEDGKGALVKCFRGKCGWIEGFRVKNEPASRSVAPRKPPPAHTEAQRTNRPEWLYQWFFARKIGARVIEAFGVYAARRWFNEELGEADAIVFPYSWRAEVVNRKYRPRAQKQPQAQEKDALQTLFNADALVRHPEEIVWVEGEPDVMAMAECGIDHAVTLKDGAPPSADASNDARLEALTTHADELAKVKRFLLAGDNDAPGLALREILARRLGRHRCWLVTWPEGCKDACDVLGLYGPEAVTVALAAAEPYPIEGVQQVKRGTLARLFDQPAPRVMSTGMAAVDAVLKLPTEGRLIVVTGYPGAGKSSWVRAVKIHTIANEERRWAVFSPEMQPWEQYVAECAEVWLGKTMWPTEGYPRLSRFDIEQAEDWFAGRLMMVVCDAERQKPTLDWLIERGEAMVQRFGVTDYLIDPWNQVDHGRPIGVTETEFIGDSLQRLASFGSRYGCNVWVNVHPAKPMPSKDGKRGGAPGPYDCHGSSHWFNRADVGITVHSPADGQAEVHRWKARFKRRWGGKTTVAALDFDPVLGRYGTPAGSDGPVAGYWKDPD